MSEAQSRPLPFLAEQTMTLRPNSVQARDVANVLHPYTNASLHETIGPMVITRGEGIHVFDDEGNRYVEALSGLFCASLGFSEERLVEAAIRQMRKLPFYHSFGHKTNEPSVELAERLIALAPAPMSKVFFANSGSEANDTAVKLVWYYHNAIGKPEKKKIVSRIRAYHGVTVASASLTGLPNNHRDFDLPIARILHTDCPGFYRFGLPGESEEAFAARCVRSLEELIEREGADTIGAFFAEPIMVSGGCIVPPPTYFEKIQAVLKKHDILLIADEVICGFGRTGAMFGCETFGIKPDMITHGEAAFGRLPADLGADDQRKDLSRRGVRERDNRNLRPRLHLRRPPRSGGGGARNPQDLRGARHRRPCPSRRPGV